MRQKLYVTSRLWTELEPHNILALDSEITLRDPHPVALMPNASTVIPS